jgi:hypothetical protein
MGSYPASTKQKTLPCIMDNQYLKAAYIELLKNLDTSYLDIPDRRPGGPKGLSGLFLPSVNDDYRSAKNKVMIVGSETAGWEPLATRLDGKLIFRDFHSVETYVDTGMQKHQAFFDKELKQKKQDRGSTFHNFTRDVAKVVGKEGLAYANLFCFDWRKSSPMRCPHFTVIKRLSQQLLNAQIDVLKPDYIVFANGITSAKYRREFFPVGDGARCSQTKIHTEITSAHFLWEFMLDEKIRCFRVHHPSARHKSARIGRAGALELLARAVAS